MPRLRKLLLRALLTLVALTGAVFAAAFVMILSSDPEFTAPMEPSPEEIEAFEAKFEQPYPSATRSFRMPDGTTLASQYLAADSDTTIVLVHGVLGAGFLLNRSSGMLREAGGAEVVAVDLRGHGASQGRPGDIDYIGQYEDDLGEVIREVRAAHPGGR